MACVLPFTSRMPPPRQGYSTAVDPESSFPVFFIGGGIPRTISSFRVCTVRPPCAVSQCVALVEVADLMISPKGLMKDWHQRPVKPQISVSTVRGKKPFTAGIFKIEDAALSPNRGVDDAVTKQHAY